MYTLSNKLNVVAGLCLLGLLSACAGRYENSALEKTESTAIPDTEIYLAEISFPENKFTIGQAINITKNSGYDNQPFFLPGNDVLLFTSIRNTDQENPQTDIYSYSLLSQSIDRVTDTPESEYSPTLTPNGESISVVRVDQDGEQRLWEFPIKSDVVTNADTSLVFSEITRIGYHVWKNQDDAFLFLVDENPQGQEHSLVSASRQKSDSDLVTTKIGRSLTMQPGSDTLIFVDKTFNEDWNLKRLDSDRNLAEIVLPTLKGSEDIVWLDERFLLMGKGSGIYMHSIEDKYQDWMLVADTKATGITGNITRLAISPDKKWLAIVVTE